MTKRTFSLSQMSNDELAQSLPWREMVGFIPKFYYRIIVGRFGLNISFAKAYFFAFAFFFAGVILAAATLSFSSFFSSTVLFV